MNSTIENCAMEGKINVNTFARGGLVGAMEGGSIFRSYAKGTIQGYTTTELKLPTSVIGGVFCAPDPVPGRCGDNTWASPPWTAGTGQQHHALRNMPGPNVQPR